MPSVTPSYRLVKIVRNICDAIDTLIKEVCDSDALDTDIWTKFYKYSSAITALEE